MRKFLVGCSFTLVLLLASSAYAAKLAPPQNKLQPLPINVQAAVSQNVQRTASQEDIQNDQQAASSEPAPDSSVAPTVTSQSVDSTGGSVSNATLLAIIFAVLLVLGGAAVWLWKTF